MRFQTEWAMKRGAKFTARNEEFGGRLIEDDEDMMKHHKELLRNYRKKR